MQNDSHANTRKGSLRACTLEMILRQINLRETQPSIQECQVNLTRYVKKPFSKLNSLKSMVIETKILSKAS